ncbi:hypothetical protein Agub_g13123 [Astrephomene gubernaculifera]|uniref:Uncharacterized protein n=1 Tax=Astrephomene gubernaculifera TaxID=47775 RepID=A0AAD3DZF4_9CHLO|nr:hypothetical protein Agub_g13123 [Astrephomene gubernaculifera]
MSASDRSARQSSEHAPAAVSSSTGLAQRQPSVPGNHSASQFSGGNRTSEKTAAEILISGSRPNSIGAQQTRVTPNPQIDEQIRSDGAVYTAHVSRASRDAPLRTSVEARPVSRPSATVAQSPYLQPPGGRGSQGQGSRPPSRPQSQQSPQTHPLQQPSTTPAGSGQTTPRGSSLPSSASPTVSTSTGTRLYQTYGSAVQRSLQPMAGATVGPAAKPSHQHPLQGSHGRPGEQPSSRANTAQQQQQQAGPRATTALSGPRSTQRGRHESGTGSLAAEAGPATTLHQQSSLRAGGAGGMAGAAPVSYPHQHHHLSAHHGSHGHGGGLAGREVEMTSTSFGYDDIPEEEDESASPTTNNGVSGLTLDQYMQRMVTTPASAAATSGLGVSADSEESVPCSPGNASTRTEEEDPLFTSPDSAAPASPSQMQMLSQQTMPAGVEAGGRQLLSSVSGRATAGLPGAGNAPPSLLRLSSSSGSRTGTAASGIASGPRGAGSSSSRGCGSAVQQAGRGAGGRCTPTFEDMFAGGGTAGCGGPGGGGGGMSLIPDMDSSDDEQHSPSTLLDSPRHARRLSSRASAMAFSNSLDLRPATAAVVSSPSMGRGDPNTPHGMSADSANHHAIIKQVDLGGLSASLFTPTPNSGREAGSPASNPATTIGASGTDLLMISNPSSPDMPAVTSSRGDRRAAAAGGPSPILRSGDPLPSGGGGGAAGLGKPHTSPKTPMGAIPPPWGVSAREGAFGGGPAGDGAGGAANLQALAARPLSSRGRPAAAAAASGGTGDGAVGAASSAGAATGSGRPASGSKWAKPQKPDGMEVPPEVRQLAAEAQSLARPPTRQVQSARPPGSRGEMELDPSVWQANIAMQLQRPPSRQKPPPEALHLWTPEQQMSMLASGGLGRPGGGGRTLGVRPQSAAPTSYRTRPSSGPSVRAHGPVGEDVACTANRPPSRQKPPPLSTLLEHDDFPPPPPAGARRARPGADQLDVVVSCSDDDDLDL